MLLNIIKLAEQNNIPSYLIKEGYKKILEIDPNNEIAKKKLGYYKYKGKWYTLEELKKMGIEYKNGKWIITKKFNKKKEEEKEKNKEEEENKIYKTENKKKREKKKILNYIALGRVKINYDSEKWNEERNTLISFKKSLWNKDCNMKLYFGYFSHIYIYRFPDDFTSGGDIPKSIGKGIYYVLKNNYDKIIGMKRPTSIVKKFKKNIKFYIYKGKGLKLEKKIRKILDIKLITLYVFKYKLDTYAILFIAPYKNPKYKKSRIYFYTLNKLRREIIKNLEFSEKTFFLKEQRPTCGSR